STSGIDVGSSVRVAAVEQKFWPTIRSPDRFRMNPDLPAEWIKVLLSKLEILTVGFDGDDSLCTAFQARVTETADVSADIDNHITRPDALRQFILVLFEDALKNVSITGAAAKDETIFTNRIVDLEANSSIPLFLQLVQKSQAKILVPKIFNTEILSKSPPLAHVSVLEQPGSTQIVLAHDSIQ